MRDRSTPWAHSSNEIAFGCVNAELLHEPPARMFEARVVRLYCVNASDSTPLVRLFNLHVDPKEWGVCQSAKFPI